MPESKVPFTPQQLQELLVKLDAVLEEAQTLRRQVTRQLVEQRRRQAPSVSPVRARTRKSSNRRG